MPSLSQVIELRATINDVLTLAGQDVRSLAATVATGTPGAATAALVAEVPAIVQSWGDVASTVSADWYAIVREGQAGSYTPLPAPPAATGQVEAMVRWAVSPLWEALDWDSAMRDLLAGSARLVRQPSRDTIERSAWADPASGAWVRIPQVDACAFCLMLASRGAVYTSKVAASEVVGRSGRPRGTRDIGEPFHDHCNCTVSPVFDPTSDVPDFNKALAREWQSVTAGKADQFAAWSEHISLTRT